MIILWVLASQNHKVPPSENICNICLMLVVSVSCCYNPAPRYSDEAGYEACYCGVFHTNCCRNTPHWPVKSPWNSQDHYSLYIAPIHEVNNCEATLGAKMLCIFIEVLIWNKVPKHSNILVWRNVAQG